MISLKIFEFLCENIKRSINYLSLFNALSWLELYRPGGKYEQDQKFFGKRKCLLNTKCIVLLNMAQNRRKILCRYSKHVVNNNTSGGCTEKRSVTLQLE